MDEEWAAAINEEYGTDVKADEAPVDDTPAEEPPVDSEEDKSEETRDSSDGEDNSESADEAPEESAPEVEEAPVEEQPKDEPEEKYSPKDAIKEALRELDQEKFQRQDTVSKMKEEALQALYPEGIDRQLRDSDGDPITGIEDLTKLINPKTGELFSSEEAGAWLLSAQQRLNADIEKMEKYAESAAETRLALEEGSNRVAELYGELLNTLPQETAEKILANYQSSLVRDPNTGVIISAPVDVVDYYSVIMEPLLLQQQAQAEAATKAEKEAATKAAKTEQSERGDLERKGSAEPPLSEDESGWDKALKSYYNQ